MVVEVEEGQVLRVVPLMVVMDQPDLVEYPMFTELLDLRQVDGLLAEELVIWDLLVQVEGVLIIIVQLLQLAEAAVETRHLLNQEHRVVLE
jgi:hypothetical protein